MKWINFSKCSKYYLLNRGLKQKNTNKKSGRSILIFTKCNRHYSLSREGLITKKIQNTQLTRRAQVFISWYPLIDRVERKSFWYKCWFTYIFANINYPCISISCISQRPGDKNNFFIFNNYIKTNLQGAINLDCTYFFPLPSRMTDNKFMWNPATTEDTNRSSRPPTKSWRILSGCPFFIWKICVKEHVRCYYII